MSERALESDKNVADMEAFINAVLDDYKNGVIDKLHAREALAHVMTALDKGNYCEARNWFEQGRKFLRQGN